MTAEQAFYALTGGALFLALAGLAGWATEVLTVPPLHRPSPMSWLALALLGAAFLCLTGMIALVWSGAVR